MMGSLTRHDQGRRSSSSHSPQTCCNSMRWFLWENKAEREPQVYSGVPCIIVGIKVSRHFVMVDSSLFSGSVSVLSKILNTSTSHPMSPRPTPMSCDDMWWCDRLDPVGQVCHQDGLSFSDFTGQLVLDLRSEGTIHDVATKWTQDVFLHRVESWIGHDILVISGHHDEHRGGCQTATQNDMSTSSDTSKKTRFCDFSRRHGNFSLTTVLHLTHVECHKVPCLPRKTTSTPMTKSAALRAALPACRCMYVYIYNTHFCYTPKNELIHGHLPHQNMGLHLPFLCNPMLDLILQVL